MKFSSAFLLAPFILLASAAPNTNPTTADQPVKDRIAAISPVESDARALVPGIVNANGVSLRTCASNTCKAVGQYNRGQAIIIVCRKYGPGVLGLEYVYFQLVFLPIELQTDDFSTHSLGGGTN
ncbi:hypothetical protein MD484_g8704, partial [Candolleomyces efflorescens]